MAADGVTRGSGGPGWGWIFGIGIVMILAGIAALILPGLAALSLSIALGWILLLYGIAGLVMGARAREGRGHPADILYGIVSLIAALFLLLFPIAGTLWLTLAVAAWLAARGVIELVAAFSYRRERGALIFAGLLNLLLAIILIAGWPFPAVQLLGVATGISFIVGGVVSIVAGLGLRRLSV